MICVRNKTFRCRQYPIGCTGCPCQSSRCLTTECFKKLCAKLLMGHFTGTLSKSIPITMYTAHLSSIQCYFPLWELQNKVKDTTWKGLILKLLVILNFISQVPSSDVRLCNNFEMKTHINPHREFSKFL